MGAPPQQLPRIDLPGLEFANLAPHVTAALQGRRRAFNSSTVVSVPGGSSGTATAQISLGSDFAAGSGVHIDDVWALFSPGDPTSELQITATRMRLFINGGSLMYELGVPIATLLSPGSGQVISRDQDKIITTEDLIGINATSGGTPPYTWNLQCLITVKNNDPTNAHTFLAVIQAIWERLDGILM